MLRSRRDSLPASSLDCRGRFVSVLNWVEEDMLKTRRSLESFKASAAAINVKDKLGAIVGGTMDGCHSCLTDA